MGGQYIEAVLAVPHPTSARWPGLCAVCRRWTRGSLCQPCLQRFAPATERCRQCALRTPAGVLRCGACITRGKAPVSACVAALDYGFPWDGLITGFKFHQRLDLADAFARLLAVASRAAPAVDLILPMPLSRQRLRERGFNQSWELARRVARQHRITASPDWLLRIRDTAHQVQLPQAQRAANVRGAFLADPRHAHRMAGRRIALVDDVMTSGATADEAARALLAAGAASVQLWVLARTPALGGA
jgi:ComF family protein